MSVSGLNKWYRKIVLASVPKNINAHLIIKDDAEWHLGSPGHQNRLEINVLDSSFYRDVVLSSNVGAMLSFCQGKWQCNNLEKLLESFALCEQRYARVMERFLAPLQRYRLWRMRNTMSQAKQNILAHYDLGNDFFQLFQCENQQYSSALYLDPKDTLDQAQLNKMTRICEQLQLCETDHLLEIGTGWGGLAIFAAQQYGCQVTTTTISDAQYTHVVSKVKQLGLENKITVLNKDYRKLTGQYDKLVSIEMIEAVGHRYLGEFFQQCFALMKSGGLFLLQAISMKSSLYDTYAKRTDFINTCIFPGGCLISLFEVMKHVKNVGLTMRDNLDMRASYIATLREWRHRLSSNRDAVLQQGFDDFFIRQFQAYFDYCIAGFAAKRISVSQMLLEKTS